MELKLAEGEHEGWRLRGEVFNRTKMELKPVPILVPLVPSLCEVFNRTKMELKRIR